MLEFREDMNVCSTPDHTHSVTGSRFLSNPFSISQRIWKPLTPKMII